MTDDIVLPPEEGCGDCDRTTTNQGAARMFYQEVSRPDTQFDPDRELVPSPNINITLENFYSNESIIGYTYNVTLTGKASSKQDRGQHHGSHINYVVGSIAKLQNILDVVGNGGKLIIKSPVLEPKVLMKFKGGRIKSFDVSPTDNNWVEYADYTIQLEFNDAEFFGCNYGFQKGCNATLYEGGAGVSGIDPGSSTIHEKLVDHKKFKIKAFNDNWNIDLQDEIYDWAKLDNSLEVNNKRYNVQYTISATGQHYWDDDGKLFPAWKQAKAFCQDRLYKQINALYTNMAMHYDGPELEPCGSSENLTTIHDRAVPSIHTTIGTMNIFDEKITFGPSESDGTFSVTYSAIVKKAKETCITSADTIHNINITRAGSYTCDSVKPTKTATLSGTIQGLLRYGDQGSIIWPNQEGFRIPDQPGQIVFLPPKGDVKHKWKNAKALLDRFIDDCDGKLICSELCSIVTKCLGAPDPSEDECDDQKQCLASCSRPSNFTITHNYNQGTIDYSLEFNYDSNSTQQNRKCNITISVEEPVPLTAEFTIPGKGVYYQPLGGCTPRKWTINADGRIEGCEAVTCDTFEGYLTVCGAVPTGCNGLIPPGTGYLLLSKQKTFNPMDCSFSYSATYACTICPGTPECS